MTLKEAIVKYGIDRVKIQFKGNMYFTHNLDAVCRLEKYWADDDYTKYVHKIKVIDELPYICRTITGATEHEQSYSFYVSDLEKYFLDGLATLIVPDISQAS